MELQFLKGMLTVGTFQKALDGGEGMSVHIVRVKVGPPNKIVLNDESLKNREHRDIHHPQRCDLELDHSSESGNRSLRIMQSNCSSILKAKVG